MDILQAKKEVIAAGLRLVEKGLIARTWGNVSCRVDENSFVITPSGKPYEGLTPDDIVEVKIDTLSYEGNVKPSSEKGVHAEVYKAHPEAGFVIHTHQKFASFFRLLVAEQENRPHIHGNQTCIPETGFFFNDFPRCEFLIRKFFPDLYFIHSYRKRIDTLALIGKPTVDSMRTDRNQHTEADDSSHG